MTEVPFGADDLFITAAEVDSEAAVSLIQGLNQELSAGYPEPGANHFQLEAKEVQSGRGTFLIAYHGSAPVGCGAIRCLNSENAEIKRMFVRPELRGRGIARRVLEALEQEARALGAQRLVLETGVRQLAALALYSRSGFERIPLFGEYIDSPLTSICMGKDL